MPQKCLYFTPEEEMYWDVPTLWNLAKNLPAKLLPVQRFAEIFDQKMWFGPEGMTFRGLAEHAKKIHEADLAYPIILAAEGWIMDGRTRLQKALMLGNEEILAVQFEKTPDPMEKKPLSTPIFEMNPPSAGKEQ